MFPFYSSLEIYLAKKKKKAEKSVFGKLWCICFNFGEQELRAGINLSFVLMCTFV